MTVSIIGDLHLGRSIYDYDLVSSTRKIMYLFYDYSLKAKVDYAVCLGDVFDRPTPNERLRKILVQWCNEFERAKIDLFILAGNHDAICDPSTGSALSSVKSTSTWRYIHIIDRPCLLDGRLFLPSPSPGFYASLTEYYNEVEKELSKAQITFCHLDIVGATIGTQEMMYRAGEYYLAEELLSANCKVFAGHIHKPQELDNVVIVGAANRLRFDERIDERFFLFVNRNIVKANVPAVLLRQLDIDATGTVTTDQIINESMYGMDVVDQIIKVVPLTDENSVIDWSLIERQLYTLGAAYVYIAPPVRVHKLITKRTDIKNGIRQQAEDFISNNVPDPDQATCYLDVFDKLRKRLEQATQ